MAVRSLRRHSAPARWGVLALSLLTALVTALGAAATPAPAAALTAVTAMSAVPSVGGVTPNEGPYEGGTLTRVDGSGFTGASAVTFGGVPATSFTVESDTRLSAVTPKRWSGASGAVNVKVTTPAGTNAYSPGDRFTYRKRPVVTGVAPSAGPAGSRVRVTGLNLWVPGALPTVTVGGNAATVAPVSESELEVLIPPRWSKANPLTDIRVETTGGLSDVVMADRFTYVVPAPGPAITSVDPPGMVVDWSRWFTATVTLRGGDFTGVTGVRFGLTPIEVTSVTADTITLRLEGYLTRGTLPIVLVRADGTEAFPTGRTTFESLAEYPAPVITGLSAKEGPTTGANTVRVSGRYFPEGTYALVDGQRVDIVTTTRTLTSIDVPMPTHAPGPVGLRVALDADRVSDPVTYTYVGTPVTDKLPHITAMSAHTGLARGGESVVISGYGFQPWVSQVKVGGVSAAVTASATNQLTVQMPPYGSLKTVDVRVTTPEGTSPIVPEDRYTYTATAPGKPPVLGYLMGGPVSPDGGTAVTLAGSNLVGTTALALGGKPVTSFTVITDVSIQFVSPTGLTAGQSVDLVATNVNGSATLTDATTVARPATIESVTTTIKDTAGGVVSVTGDGLDGATYWLGTQQLTSQYWGTGADRWGNQAQYYTVNVTVPQLAAGSHTLTIKAKGGSIDKAFWVTDSQWCRTVTGTITVAAGSTLRIGCPEFSFGADATLVVEPGATFDLPNATRLANFAPGVQLPNLVARADGGAAPVLRGDLRVTRSADVQGADITGTTGFGDSITGLSGDTVVANGTFTVRDSTFRDRVMLGAGDAARVTFTGNTLRDIPVGGRHWEDAGAMWPALAVASKGTSAAAAPTVTDNAVLGCHSVVQRRCAALFVTGTNIHPEKITGTTASDVDLPQQRIAGTVTGQWTVPSASPLPWVVADYWSASGVVRVSGTLTLEPGAALTQNPRNYVVLDAEDRLVRPAAGDTPATVGLQLFARTPGTQEVNRIDCTGLVFDPADLGTTYCR